MRMRMKGIIFLSAFSLLLSACMTTNHSIKFPEKLLFQPQTEKQPYRLALVVSPADRALPFDQCEKLTGGSACYHGVAGTLLAPSAEDAFGQHFEKVIVLEDMADPTAGEADLVLALSFREVRLDTAVDGFVATRKVTVAIREELIVNGKPLSDRELRETTACIGLKCRVEGRDVGLAGTEVVLQTLFVPGYLAGIGDRYAGIISTAYSASLKAALLQSSEDLASRTASLIHEHGRRR